MSSTLVRVISAVVAVLALLAIGYYGGAKGLGLLATLVILWGVIEFVNMAFPVATTSLRLRIWVKIYSVFTFLGLIYFFSYSLSILALTSILFFTGGLWLTRNRLPNPQLLSYLSAGTLGIIYFVTLPVFALKLLSLHHSLIWFGLLLVIVFFGDTAAYFGGRFLGKTKLMPNISPKKTVAGAWSGLLGSVIGGVVFLILLLPEVPWYWTATFALTCGFIAQSGDLFVSLVKRVADVKDSGHIMPGHGGVLDRLDGVYISAPLVYGFAQICEFYF